MFVFLSLLGIIYNILFYTGDNILLFAAARELAPRAVFEIIYNISFFLIAKSYTIYCPKFPENILFFFTKNTCNAESNVLYYNHGKGYRTEYQ